MSGALDMSREVAATEAELRAYVALFQASALRQDRGAMDRSRLEAEAALSRHLDANERAVQAALRENGL